MIVQTEIPIGSEFVGYRIDALIGRGGMGVVYRAYDLRLKRTVALKLMAPELASDQQFRERFAREAELAISLEHPNVVPIHDAGDIDGRLYLAMRHVEGTDLKALLHMEGALEPARAIAICGRVAHALDAAHASGLVHRDVKPSNVLLDRSEHVYLADFGLTRRLDEQSSPASEGRFAGTPAYLAPEQIEGGPVEGRTDVYALGCLLYECLTGEIPFARDSRLAVAWAHLEEPPPRPSERHPQLPGALDAVIAKAMAKELGSRYSTSVALISAAEEALGFRKTRFFARRRSLVLTTGSLAAAVVAAGIVAVAFLPGRNDKVVAPLFAGADTLARIDPATNNVSAVVDVGAFPVAVAAGGHSVWVYNRDDGTISEVDTETNHVLKTTPVASQPPDQCCGLFSGPVLAADRSGAWFVNGGVQGKPLLTHLLADGRRARVYPLELTPTGVAVGADAVWVVGHRAHDYQVVRIDPATGRATEDTRFPASARIASIAFGYGAVWVVSPSSATLYRINPRSTRVEGSVALVTPRATRPEIMPRGHDVWVKVTAGGGTTYRIDPATLTVVYSEHDGPPSWEEDRAELGALWWYDWPTGAVYRQEDANGLIRTIHITQQLPIADGPCLTSITVGSASLWVTVAPLPPNRLTCER